MKNYLLRFVLIGAMLGCTLFLSDAQDIITLKKGRQIEAIVTEIKDDIVRFKYFSDPQGKERFFYKDMIASILYQNGTVQKFDEPEQQTTVDKSEREEAGFNSTQDVIVTKTGEEINGNKDVFDEITDQQQTTTNQKISPYNKNVDYQQLPVLKYTFGNQISPYGSKKSPFLAGFLSFLIPGVGQFYNGDVGGGFLYLGCNVVCNTIWMNSIKTDYYGNTTINSSAFTFGFIGALAVNIISIVDAVQGAYKVNFARGYRLGDTYLKIQPTIIKQNNPLQSKEYAYGMNFSLDF